MLISVCIAAYRATTIGAAIASIRSQTYANWELVVIGQGHECGLSELVHSAAETDHRIKYVQISTAGTCRARNAGILHSSGEIVAFIDDDCEASTDWLDVIANCFATHPEVGVVGGDLVAPKQSGTNFSCCPNLSVSESIFDPDQSANPPAGWDLIGCNIAVRRKVLLEHGGFDEHLGPGTLFPAGEDTDFKLKLLRSRVKMLTTPRSIVNHTHGRRDGIKACFKLVRGYTLGNAATAAKLTLLGSSEGPAWLKATRRDFWRDALKVHRLPWTIYRLYLFRQVYEQCIAEFTIENGYLKPKAVNHRIDSNPAPSAQTISRH